MKRSIVEVLLFFVVAADLVNGVALPGLPSDGFHVALSATPAGTAVATFGFSNYDVRAWTSGGRLRRRTVTLGIPTVVYTDLCELYGKSLAVVGSASVAEVCTAVDMVWPPPTLFGTADNDWDKGELAVACPESPTGLCDLYTRVVDNVLWKTTWTARYAANSARPVSCTVVGLLGATTVANVTLWDPTPQLFTLPVDVCEDAIASATLNNSDDEDITASDAAAGMYFDDTSNDDPERPPRLPCVGHVKFVVEIGSSGIAYTQEKWTTLGASLSAETVSGVPLTDDVTTTRLVRRDLNRTFTTTSSSETCSVSIGQDDLDDGKIGTFDIDTLSWTKSVVAAPCSYDAGGGACDLYTGTSGGEKLRLWYTQGSNRMLAGRGTRTVLFVSIDIPVTIVTWESGALEDSSAFDVGSQCGTSWQTLADAPGSLVLSCLGLCSAEFPSETAPEIDSNSASQTHNNAPESSHNLNSEKAGSNFDSDGINGVFHVGSVPLFAMLLLTALMLVL